ncbi:M23 family metallopeptidase [Nitrincola alkalilacustris]|uniref:M23 family metallopeptidase n=1 Tax=Nitrincola alkalilacustris TaxID=1571224 RepID=UPI00197E00BA|nr:M23 family metallopeptidase [Nitrincola alkalilacustris]
MPGLIRFFHQHPLSTHFLAGLISAAILLPVIWTLLQMRETQPASTVNTTPVETTHNANQFRIHQETPDNPLVEHLAIDHDSVQTMRTAINIPHDAMQLNHFTTPFLGTPVEGGRISSTFQPDRRHPILGIIRPHRGIDYAAPYGTPVRATASGTVIRASRKGSYGHTVILQHGDRISTLYAHLSQYRKNLIPGEQIRQGEVIGYVGSSGLATGPHLHYELRIDGSHHDPILAKNALNNSTPELPLMVQQDTSERSFFRQRSFTQASDRTVF